MDVLCWFEHHWKSKLYLIFRSLEKAVYAFLPTWKTTAFFLKINQKPISQLWLFENTTCRILSAIKRPKLHNSSFKYLHLLPVTYIMISRFFLLTIKICRVWPWAILHTLYLYELVCSLRSSHCDLPDTKFFQQRPGFCPQRFEVFKSCS